VKSWVRAGTDATTWYIRIGTGDLLGPLIREPTVCGVRRTRGAGRSEATGPPEATVDEIDASNDGGPLVSDAPEVPAGASAAEPGTLHSGRPSTPAAAVST
jgi:hypothetical protein